jgi:glyoxylase-like metal-dependent hydrolase (beta-lactamase superfamily II)
MAAAQHKVISIGALSVHELWQAQGSARTPHATTTLVTSGDAKSPRRVLVDPGLPGQVLGARLAERAGLTPADISDVFLTCFRPAHRAGLETFGHANWWMHPLETERMQRQLTSRIDQEDDNQVVRILEQDLALLERLREPEDRLADGVDLFPLPGFTPGTCGLLLPQPGATVLIAGDAVATGEHLRAGRVLRGAFDVELAAESLTEAVEIADLIVCGHDEAVLNPTRRF